MDADVYGRTTSREENTGGKDMNTPNHVYSVSVRALTHYEARKQTLKPDIYNRLVRVFGWQEW